MLARVWRKGNPCSLLVGVQIGVATVENSLENPQKLKIELPYDLASPLLGMYLKKPKTNAIEHMHPYVHCSIIYNSQDREAAQAPTNRHVDKEDVAQIYNSILLSHEK